MSLQAISKKEYVYFDLGETHPIYSPSNVKVSVLPLQCDGQLNVGSSEGPKVL